MKRKYNTGIVERHKKKSDYEKWIDRIVKCGFFKAKSLECCPNGSEGEE
jgi:hypothetical protein